ncbi:MAG: indolepyruvate ferredoxin oxidoreductase subunit alpha, partial [Clostridia bacterium]|nr:indolepyruvate ferredoxin oxidoreductase subunit alpha [Clostridia bacterium]
MHKEFLMGNEAMALGALAAGVGLVAGYPGTPSTEVLETVAKRNPGGVHVEWSVNEKAAMEVAAGAAYAGVRSLVTMKQVGLNVASDPLMSLSYIGVKGGMVVLVADDPGPISSQTEQDTRTFAMYSKLPVFD